MSGRERKARPTALRPPRDVTGTDMDGRWLLPHTKDFYLRAEDVRHVTWEERPEPDIDRFTVRITFVHPTIPSMQFDDYSWSEVLGFARWGIRMNKAVPD